MSGNRRPVVAEHQEHLRLAESDDVISDVPDELAVIAAVIDGDQRAARTVWVRYAPMVYGAVRRMLGPEGEVDDVVQEVFMVLFSHIRKLEDRRALRSFIYSIAIRVTRSTLRGRWVRRIMTLTPTGSVPEGPTPGVPHEAREAVSRLYHLLDRLSSTERTFFVLRNIEKLTVDEIAAATQLSRSTVKRRVLLANERAEKLLSRDPLLAGYLLPKGEDDDSR